MAVSPSTRTTAPHPGRTHACTVKTKDTLLAAEVCASCAAHYCVTGDGSLAATRPTINRHTLHERHTVQEQITTSTHARLLICTQIILFCCVCAYLYLCFPPGSECPLTARCLITKPLPAWLMSEEKRSVASWEVFRSTRPGMALPQNIPVTQRTEKTTKDNVCNLGTGNMYSFILSVHLGHTASKYLPTLMPSLRECVLTPRTPSTNLKRLIQSQ